jgi:hypothetical protein
VVLGQPPSSVTPAPPAPQPTADTASPVVKDPPSK